jgi:hypothetical protein
MSVSTSDCSFAFDGNCYCEELYYGKKCPFFNISQCPVHNPEILKDKTWAKGQECCYDCDHLSGPTDDECVCICPKKDDSDMTCEDCSDNPCHNFKRTKKGIAQGREP